jgi:hypothetical protein
MNRANDELPENLTDCVVITRSFSQDGKIITSTRNSCYYRRSDKWGHVNGCHVLAWVYTHELIQLCGLNQYLGVNYEIFYL